MNIKKHGCAVAALLALTGCQHKTVNPTPKPALTPVKVQPVQSEPGTEETTYTANIVAEDEIPLSFRTSGYVERVLQVQGRDVQEGDNVAKGAVLARLRQADFESKASQTRSQAAQVNASFVVATSQQAEAKVAYDSARVDQERANRLFSSQSLTKPEFDAAQTKMLSAGARLDAAQAQVQAVQAQMNAAGGLVRDAELAQEDSVLRAPIMGIVLQRAADAGALASPGNPAFVLAITSTVKAVFGVPDTLIFTLKAGQTLVVESEASPGTVFRGQISQIAPAADAKSRVFDVHVRVSNPGGRLKPGMIVSVKIRRDGGKDVAAERLVVPLSAVVRSKKDPSQYAVFVAEGGGGRITSRLREIRIGGILDQGVSVLSGVAAGERVVTTGSTLIGDGEVVLVVP